MGILGLLQYLKCCTKERRMTDYKGKTAAVDTYAWYTTPYSGSTKSSRDQLEDSSSLEAPTDTNTSRTASNASRKYKIVA